MCWPFAHFCLITFFVNVCLYPSVCFFVLISFLSTTFSSLSFLILLWILVLYPCSLLLHCLQFVLTIFLSISTWNTILYLLRIMCIDSIHDRLCMDTLNQHPNPYSLDTWLTLVNSRLVDSCIDWKLVDCPPRCRWSVNQVLIEGIDWHRGCHKYTWSPF